MSTLTTCLWFDTEAEEAATFYTSIFPNSGIGAVARYSEAGPGEAGSVMTVSFELDGQSFMGINGGPEFTHSEAVSFQIPCESQEEVDRYWARLTQGGEESVCGWLKDRFGISWQVTPRRLVELLGGSDPATAARVAEAMFKMRKIDIAAIEEAAGNPA
ncbi:MAG TPA: VOC family protein [Thermoleophilaceae bacterium]|nr:VOC family protein [Thermoleophilaceae bacterium]